MEKATGQHGHGAGAGGELTADNGVGMEPEQIEEIFRRKPDGKSGIGIKNVNDRLKIWFGDAYGITIESVPDEGTKVTVRMPKVREEVEHEKH